MKGIRDAGTALLLGATALTPLVWAAPAWAIANETDLRNAIFSANGTTGSQTITLTGDITLTQSLPMITDSITFDGAGFTIDADNTGRVFFIQGGTSSISNVTVNNARAQGGDGGLGAFGTGGGGGLGAGAAVFVNAGASADLANVTLGNAAAQGGTGGEGWGGDGFGGGGGGFGGNGGSAASGGGGGGGYAGAGGIGGGLGGGGGGGEFDNGGQGRFGGGGAGGGGQGGRGGGVGGDGGQGGVGGGGGGGGGLTGSGDGGDFGGGGGDGGNGGSGGGNGGFGGGGGGARDNTLNQTGGAGGFGGGGGGGQNAGNGGSFGGRGGAGAGADGGGGAALGGAIFVRDGGNLTLSNVTLGGSYSVTAGGTGGSGGATAGQAQGRLVFLHGTGATDLNIASGSETLAGADALAGDGRLIKSGAGTLAITGANANYSGSVTLSGGTLLLGDSNALGSGTLTTTGSTVAYADGVTIATPITVNSNTTQLQVATGTATQSGDITETGGSRPLEKTGAGTLILTGTAGHTGGTTVSAGTLQIGNGGTTGSLTGDVTNNGTLTFDRSDDIVFGGAISGTGSLTKRGAGSLILTGTSNFTGGTAVTGGNLIVTGTLGDVTLNAGGTLGGTGTLDALTANGRVAPGTSIGTLNSGPVIFNPGSVLAVEIAPDGRADLLNVTGTATLNGGAVEIAPQAGGYASGQSFTIIQTTGGVAGTFDSVGYAPGQVLALLDPSLLYQGNDVLLLLTRNSRDFEATLDDPDLRPTGRALDRLEDDPTPTGGALIQDLLGLSDAELNEATRQLSGSGLTGGAQLVQLAGQTVLSLVPTGNGGSALGGTAGLTQFALAERGASDALSGLGLAAAGGPETMQESGPRFWFEGLGGFGSRDGQGAAADQGRYYAGAAGGLVLPLNEEISLSLGVGGFGGQVATDDGLAETETTSLLAAAKLTWSPGPWQVSGSLGFAGHRFESERELRFTGFTETAEGERDGVEVLGDLAVGYDWQLSGVTLTPTAGLGASWLYQESWSESGAGEANLEIDSADTLSLQPRLGVGVATDLDLGQGLTLTPRAQALWIGRLGDESTDTTTRFAGSDASWRVPDLEEPDHSAALSLGADLAAADGWALSAGYAGRFGDGARDHGFLLGGRLRF